MGDPRCLMSVRDVITLAADAYDQPLVPQCRERMRGGAVRNPVFLGKAQDRGHAASQLPGGDLVANEIGQLLVQRNRRLMVEHEPQPTSPVSARVRWGLPVRTRAYTEIVESENRQAAGDQVQGVLAPELAFRDVNDGDDALQMAMPDVLPQPVTETQNAGRARALLRETALRALI